MNDSNVSFATFASFKGLTKRFPRDAAYLLFYRKQQVQGVVYLPHFPNLSGYQKVSHSGEKSACHSLTCRAVLTNQPTN